MIRRAPTVLCHCGVDVDLPARPFGWLDEMRHVIPDVQLAYRAKPAPTAQQRDTKRGVGILRLEDDC